MTIRRLAAADCTKLSTFIAARFLLEPAFVNLTPPTTAKLAEGVAAGVKTWIAVESNKVVGVLGPASFGERLVLVEGVPVEDMERRTTVHFGCLLATAPRIAKQLTIFAANELQAEGPPDDIRITGAATCSGASWCRAMALSEEPQGGRSEWVVPFAEIWTRAGSVVTP